MTDEEIWSFVTDAHTGIMTTLRRDGVPIALPLWFVCLDRRIYLRTRGKKLQRIANDGRAGFLVEAGERWADLKAVHLTGRAEIVDLDAELARRFGEEMDRKYAPFRTNAEEMPAETAKHYATAIGGVVRFTPEGRILNWDNHKLVG
jgi:nitroimidazol reductase NimA-like FMN-containing flavoprotein (pyridoxamine 5'-phosphate oxidase superfamily)